MPVTHFHSLFGGRGFILRIPEHWNEIANFPSSFGLNVHGIRTYINCGCKTASNSTDGSSSKPALPTKLDFDNINCLLPESFVDLD